MESYLNFSVFSDSELEIIINASTRLTEMLRKSQCFNSNREMYDKFTEWRTIVNIQCAAHHALLKRSKIKEE